MIYVILKLKGQKHYDVKMFQETRYFTDWFNTSKDISLKYSKMHIINTDDMHYTIHCGKNRRL